MEWEAQMSGETSNKVITLPGLKPSKDNIPAPLSTENNGRPRQGLVSLSSAPHIKASVMPLLTIACLCLNTILLAVASSPEDLKAPERTTVAQRKCVIITETQALRENTQHCFSGDKDEASRGCHVMTWSN